MTGSCLLFKQLSDSGEENFGRDISLVPVSGSVLVLFLGPGVGNTLFDF